MPVALQKGNLLFSFPFPFPFPSPSVCLNSLISSQVALTLEVWTSTRRLVSYTTTRYHYYNLYHLKSSIEKGLSPSKSSKARKPCSQ